MKAYVPFSSGRISEIAQVIGLPDAQRHEQTAVHHCYWQCGCEAVNLRGLCHEDGWSLVPCGRHPDLVRPGICWS